MQIERLTEDQHHRLNHYVEGVLEDRFPRTNLTKLVREIVNEYLDDESAPGVDHREQAEWYLTRAEKYKDFESDERAIAELCVAKAQVHATLAMGT